MSTPRFCSLELTLLTLDTTCLSVRFYACLQPQHRNVSSGGRTTRYTICTSQFEWLGLAASVHCQSLLCCLPKETVRAMCALTSPAIRVETAPLLIMVSGARIAPVDRVCPPTYIYFIFSISCATIQWVGPTALLVFHTRKRGPGTPASGPLRTTVVSTNEITGHLSSLLMYLSLQ